MLRNIFIFVVVSSLSLSSFAYAAPWHSELGECPEAAKVKMDADFGEGTSAKTHCLQVRNNIKVVVSWNNTTVNKRSGFGQQAQSTKNLIKSYEDMYGLVAGDNYRVSVVSYDNGGRWLLNDEAYNRIFNVTTGNPTAPVVALLLERKIPVYLCQNTMRGKGWVSSDLIPGVEMVPSGVAGVVDFQHRGYVSLKP